MQADEWVASDFYKRHFPPPSEKRISKKLPPSPPLNQNESAISGLLNPPNRCVDSEKDSLLRPQTHFGHR